MARGQEETSTSGGPERRLRATLSASSIISSLTMEELMDYCEVPDNIDLRLMERTDESTLGGEHNDVFLPWSTLQPGYAFLCSPSQAVFAFYSGAPGSYPPQFHLYFDRCFVLNHLYQLDLSLVELCIIYFLRVGQGGRMSMSCTPDFRLLTGSPTHLRQRRKECF